MVLATLFIERKFSLAFGCQKKPQNVVSKGDGSNIACKDTKTPIVDDDTSRCNAHSADTLRKEAASKSIDLVCSTSTVCQTAIILVSFAIMF